MFNSMGSFQSVNGYKKYSPNLIRYFAFDVAINSSQLEYFGNTVNNTNSGVTTALTTLPTQFISTGQGSLNMYNSNKYIDISLDGVGYTELTICFWVKYNVLDSSLVAPTSKGCLALVGSGTEYILLGGVTVPQFGLPPSTFYVKTKNTGSTGNSLTFTTPQNVNITTWYHYAFTILKSPTNTTTTLLIYINGTNISYTNSNTFVFPATSTYSIKTFDHTVSKTFDGSISDLRIYNRVLTSDEITNIYQNQNPKNIYIP